MCISNEIWVFLEQDLVTNVVQVVPKPEYSSDTTILLLWVLSTSTVFVILEYYVLRRTSDEVTTSLGIHIEYNVQATAHQV